MNLKLLLAISFLSAQGCSTFKEVIPEPYPVYFEIKCTEPGKLNPIKTFDIQPLAVEDKAGNWWVSVNYLNVAKNTDETIRYIKEQKAVIGYYEDCITDFNSKIDDLKNKE
jgi:hypothetical protein